MILPNPDRFRSNRRDFLKKSSAATAGGLLALNFAVHEKAFAANNDTLKIGLVGCGGRGTGAAREALTADGNTVLVAMGDIFEDKLKASLAELKKARGEQVQVTPDHCFVGLDAYQKVLASGVDVMVFATPPGFRPQHFEASVQAGKHTFIEKPVSTDVSGIKRVMAAMKEAEKKNLGAIAGFCWRYDASCREVFKRIQDGQMGDVRASYHTYYTGPVKPMPPASRRRPSESDVEWQLRNWYNFNWLSGDGFVEQAIHSVDKMAWLMHDVPPLKAVAVGGRQTPNNEGNIFDHMEVNYEFADGIRAFVVHRQIPNCHGENRDYLIGAKGVANLIAFGRPVCEIKTPGNDWRWTGPVKTMYQVEHDEFFASIRAGKPMRDGDRIWTSTLIGLMGRMAAYTGAEITWEQMLGSQEKLVADNLTWDMTLPIEPMAIPGKTKYV